MNGTNPFQASHKPAMDSLLAWQFPPRRTAEKLRLHICDLRSSRIQTFRPMTGFCCHTTNILSWVGKTGHGMPCEPWRGCKHPLSKCNRCRNKPRHKDRDFLNLHKTHLLPSSLVSVSTLLPHNGT